MPKIREFMTTPSPSGKELSLGIDDDARLYVNGEPVVTGLKLDR